MGKKKLESLLSDTEGYVSIPLVDYVDPHVICSGYADDGPCKGGIVPGHTLEEAKLAFERKYGACLDDKKTDS